MEKKKMFYTGRLTIIGLLLLILSVFVAGGGHGYFELLYLVFPIPSLTVNFFDEINLLTLILLLIQYPIYGYILDRNKTKIRKTSLIILGIHIVFAVIAFQFMPEKFQ